MYDPETTDMPVLDHFGAEGLLKLSQRLMDWYEDPIRDDEIAEVLSLELVPAFRYAQAKLAGKVRRVTQEPAFCHSADVAFRAVELGYPTPVIMSCFLHDVIEDTSRSIADMPDGVRDLKQHFPSDVVHDVISLTNRYQLIFKKMRPKVHDRVSLDIRGVRAFRAALDVVRYELPSAISACYAREFDELAAFFESPQDMRGARMRACRDRSFTLASFLEREVYNLYVDDLVRRAREVTLVSNGGAIATPLIVKFMDLIDNVRTSEVSNRLALFKLVSKAESIIDRTRAGFIDVVPEGAARRTTLPTLLRIVQVRLIDQLKLRRRAIAQNFSETRFASLVDFLEAQTNRLESKYGVEKHRVETFTTLEQSVREWNRARFEL